tara:strand:- start:132 stop:863 length:732 start_codon:yes stop_codon:yes gene_type:complete
MHPIPCNEVTVVWEDIYNDYELFNSVPSYQNSINQFSENHREAFEELYLAFENFHDALDENELFELNKLEARNGYRNFRSMVLSYLTTFHNKDCKTFVPEILDSGLSFQNLELNYSDEWMVVGWYYFWMKRLELGDLNISWNRIIPEYFNERVIEKVFKDFLLNNAINTVSSEITKLIQLIASTFTIYSELQSQNKNLVNHQKFINRLNLENNFHNELGIALNNLKEKLRLSGYLIEYDLRIK